MKLVALSLACVTLAMSTPATAQQYVRTDTGQPVYLVAPHVQAASDPYGFVPWLNATRARHGLSPVVHDPTLAAWASRNNAHQSVRGMGHHVMGPARRQNAAMGAYASVPGMWMASPAHRAALLDPTIRFVGIAGAGAYWTMNAY